MLDMTLTLLAAAMLLHATAASLAIWGFFTAARRRWAWLCLAGACMIWGLRSAVPFWVAVRIGLYDFNDALMAAASAGFFLAALLALVQRAPQASA